MAKHVLKDAWVSVNSVDLSDHVRSVTINMDADLQDVKAMGAVGADWAAGLRNDSIELTLYQDFDAAKVDATLFPLFDGGSAFVIAAAASGTAISSTNPKYSGTVLMGSYQPLAGEVGAANITSITFPVQGKVARATA